MRFLDWNSATEPERAAALARPATSSPAAGVAAAEIVRNVCLRGDNAIREYTRSLDGVDVEHFRLSDDEISLARHSVDRSIQSAVRDAIDRVRTFHSACRPQRVSVETAPGITCERRPEPIQSVGLYVPAGRSPLPSTAIMLGVPSALADCPVRVLCVPPRPDGSVDPVVVFAASECGITSIFRIGGAQAIAAMAYGTDSVPKCDKLFGPGNAYVTAAKMLVAQDPDGAAIDMPAGPSEVLVVADSSADPTFVAADLLSQCEHGPDSQVLLVTDSRATATAVLEQVERQLDNLPSRQVAAQSAESSCAILVDSMDDAIDVANRYAPEHLIINARNASALVDFVRTAGSVFLGQWTPETLGDYCSGTNHVLPTYGFARSYSGLSVDSFMRFMTVQRASQSGLAALGNTAITLARAEGLEAHARAVLVRLDHDEDNVEQSREAVNVGSRKTEAAQPGSTEA